MSPALPQFYLWSGQKYYPQGPTSDYRGAFHTLDDAVTAAKVFASDVDPNAPEDWYEIMTPGPDGALVRVGRWLTRTFGGVSE